MTTTGYVVPLNQVKPANRVTNPEPAWSSTVLKELETAQIRYCVLRDIDRLAPPTPKQEIDLLVDKQQLSLLRQVLAQAGFVELPNWGHRPHHFFITYRATTDSWLKLDVVTAISYGAPDQRLDTALASQVLLNRRYTPPFYIPLPEDELVLLLLHCLLDKGVFAPKHQKRLGVLRNQVRDESYLNELLTAYCSPGITWSELADWIERGDWPGLLAWCSAFYDQIAAWRRPVITACRVRDRILRNLNRWSRFWRPLAPTVAILAPDGTGKSTLIAGLQSSFFLPVQAVYMGLYQNSDNRQPWLPPGAGLLARAGRLWKGYLSGRFNQARGRLVVFDRYTYDALLQAKKPLGWAGRLRRWLLAHICPAPGMVLLLDAPGVVLYERKGEHDPTFLEQQRQGYLQLVDKLPLTVILDATQSPDVVRRQATSAIWQRCQEQSGRGARQ